ncbi:MAG: hypothetical protein QOD14_1456 [Solirubrobacterales bacterium]|jgi:hypothetical protein|nr:hypothetical protein [Solirubrobacterales bacterium]
MLPATLLGAASTPPAGGAATSDVIYATAGAMVVSVLLFGPVLLYKLGRFPALGRLADLDGRITRLPGWASLPGTVLLGALLIAVFGMYWDISLHIDQGRDPGPLANPAHYFILAGLFGVLLAGVLGLALPERPTRTSIRLAPGVHAPIGALMIAICGASSLLAFPLDDIWHRIFGQDVTLWGPTHLMLIGGASLSTLGAWALHAEGDEERKAARRPPSRWTRIREIVIAGSFLVALSTFQGEFDFGVPQFALALQPTLIMLAAGIGLVTARIRIGPGGAVAALAVYVAIRGTLTILVGPLFGEIVPHFPPYLAEALLIEGVAFAYLRGKPAAERPITFGALSGVAIGTIGLAAEWAWSHVWVVNPWPTSLFPEAAVTGLIAAIAGGVIGGFVGRALTPSVERRERIPRPALAVAGVAAVGAIAFLIPVNAGPGVRATFDLNVRNSSDGRVATGIVRLNPPDAANDAYWFNVTSWQGKDGPAHIDTPERIGPGLYRITQPIHVDGTWKTTLRLHKGRELASVPIFLPADPAIPVSQIPVEPQMTRSFVLDHRNLQREQKPNVPGWLTLVAYLGVGGISFALIFVVGWGLSRLERLGGRARGASPADSATTGKRRTRRGSRRGARPSVAS